MKNKFLKHLLFIVLLVITSFKVLSEEFEIKATKITLSDKGNILKAEDNILINTNDGLEIIADKAIYNKKKNILTTEDNIVIKTKDKIQIVADKAIYNKKNLELNLKGRVIFHDTKNNTIFKSNSIVYKKKEQLISSNKKTETVLEDTYFIKSENLYFNRNSKKISSTKKIEIRDNFGNKIISEDIKFSLIEKFGRGKNIVFLDNQKNIYNIENGVFDLKNNKILGKDIEINFSNKLSGNKKNDPRIKGNSIYADKNKTIISKGVFTTCQKREGCPPWVISSEEVIHDKKKKVISYKNAWVKLYDKPIVYFPKFYHPDPTVKRASGFLTPTLINSKNVGSLFSIPYYHVLSENKDLTITPILQANNKFILQSEYREVGKNFKHTFDISGIASTIFSNNKSSKGHFFSNSIFDTNFKRFGNSKITLNLEKTTNDNYLEKYKLKSQLINDYSSLHSYLKFEGSGDDYWLTASLEAYENLNKIKRDRYEFIYPKIDFVKEIDENFLSKGNLSLNSNFFQKIYETNKKETVLINDLIFNSNPFISQIGTKNDYKLIFKNVNSSSENSSNYKSDDSNQLLSAFLFKSSYPLKKEHNKYKSILNPIFSYRYSPNKSKNKQEDDRRLDISNIYSFNRIGYDDTIEGGQSITIGNEYRINNNEDREIFGFNIAQVFRDEINEDLPSKSTLGNNSSEIVGKVQINPLDSINVSYDFSLDNNLDRSNYDYLQANFNVNNFVTSFKFLEEKNIIGNESFVEGKITYNFQNNNSLSFSTRENKKTNITEFYNLIYQYRNDCLEAAIEYNKDYYADANTEPEEQLFFSISIKPFGSASTKGAN